jgi:putative transcriptional regulator
MSSLAGNFLIARSSLRDGFFGRTVILLLQHGDEGAFGLVLNRPAKAEDLPFPVYVGGPCKMDGLLMIHGQKTWLNSDDDAKMEVCPGVFLGTAEHFEKATVEGEGDNNRFRVFTGYAGWAPDQLESEMEQGAWLVVPGRGELIFETAVDDLWEKLAPPTMPQPSMN